MSSVAEGSVTALYKKRAGTSGISGQLYETKLVCLVYFRLLHNENVETFHLASNVDEIGAFDDICLKLKLKNYYRQILILVQAKHKDNDDSTLDDKNELVKWCESIMKVKEKFGSNKDDDRVFKENFNDVDCLFVVYTNAKYDFGKTVSSSIFESSYATDVNDLLSTGSVGSQPNYTDKDLEEFSETIMNEEIPILAERFEKFLNDSQSMNVMNNDYIIRYHVILGQKVVNISDIQEKRGTKCRVLSFRDDFFDTNDKYLALLRKYLYENFLKNREKVKKSKELNALISSFLADPCANTLGPLIDRHIIYKNEKLEFTSKRPQIDIQLLEKINISPDVIEETRATTAKNILKALNLAVPTAFGNLDLAIRGNADKIEQRLNHLTKIFKELFEKSKQIEPYKVVTIDDTIDEGILSCNGGIGGCVGNIFTYDENTKLLKFLTDHTSLDNNAKSLYLKLEANFNLDEFRFDVQTSKFPKLTFDCYNIAREFLSRLVIFSKQGNHFDVEKKFKEEKEALCKKNKRYVFTDMDSDVLFVRYHNEIQKWWMLPKSGPYLTRENSFFTKTLQDIRRERWEYRKRTSLVNIKRRHLLRILAKERQSSTTETQNSSPDVLESTNGNSEESIPSLPLEIGKSECPARLDPAISPLQGECSDY